MKDLNFTKPCVMYYTMFKDWLAIDPTLSNKPPIQISESFINCLQETVKLMMSYEKARVSDWNAIPIAENIHPKFQKFNLKKLFEKNWLRENWLR